MSPIVTTTVTSTVSQPPVRSSVPNVSTTARPAPPTVQPPQPATPPTSKKEGRHTSVVMIANHELYVTIATKESTKGRGALLSDIRKGTSLKKAVTNDRSAPKLS